MLVAGLLLLLGIVSNKFTARAGLPALLVFLGIGMLAGAEGPGGIVFDSFPLAHGIGTFALVIILFDGGMRTSLSGVRKVWKPSLLMATFGVVVTAGITGAVAAHALDLSMLQGMLIGAIVGSTDAGAVFSIMRASNLSLDPRLMSTLKIESGSNDPMAIFLTVGLIEVLLGNVEMGPQLLGLFVLQMGVGAAAGLASGWIGLRLANRVNLPAIGLYPVFIAAWAMSTYGATVALGGSGYLAVYIVGITLGNADMVFKRGTLLFHDGVTWMGEITMFVVLGMLCTPSDLPGVAPSAFLIALTLIFVARPAAVFTLLWPFGFSFRELLFIGWVGLKGSVPIILATYPLLLGLVQSSLVFHVVFFVVVISALVQGWSLSAVATWLGLQTEEPPEPPISLEITSLRHVDADIVRYDIDRYTRAVDKSLSELAFPAEAVVAMVTRGTNLIPARGDTRLQAGDHVFVVLRENLRDTIDEFFARDIDTVE
ncbi:potassium/proton antiporter [Bradymonas sediminis]|uniref:potassium/proton antiporter n=1 Tax=Bradymonas sediminis TaxID=1548548 RepID=UPI0023B81595|nr:potassium/proton antiporter [Bradymonas sediminis]